MATAETVPQPKTTLELICQETGVPYTDELAEQEKNIENLRRLGELADHTKRLSEQLTPRHHDMTTTTATTPEIQHARVESHSIACERHSARNEDSSFVINLPGVGPAGGVFDGVGGYRGSERASRITAEFVHAAYAASDAQQASPAVAATLATRFLHEAEAAVRRDSEFIATTAAMASVHTDPHTGSRFATLAWAGDSRVYVIRGGEIIYRTLDDSRSRYTPMLDELYPDEALEYRTQAFLESVEDVYDYPDDLRDVFRERNIIANCLGGRGELHVHTHYVPVHAGDIILASTDGVHDNLTNQEILAVIAGGGSTKDLTELALTRSRDTDHSRSKPDDITAVIIHV